MKLSCEMNAGWPPLTWIAHFVCGGDELHLQHGSAVEVGDKWFAEAVWDGPFEESNFDQTDVVFGSGGRQRDGRWVFVSSGTTLDRLHWHESNDNFYVSNSLACLTARLGATVDPHCRDYFAFFESIIHGFNRYQKMLPTSAGDVHLTYFRNLVFDGDTLLEVEKPNCNRYFESFEEYEAVLTEVMIALGRNIGAAERKIPLSSIASISTGYDSPAVAAVARHAGLQETLSIIDARGGADDDGSEIARLLGLKPIGIPRDDWRGTNETSLDVTRFIASDAKGEDVYFAPAAEVLKGRVLFTGYRGSRVWKPTATGGDGLGRTDQSGLSHTEARLHGQYLHVPVPFIGALAERDLRTIGSSDAMKPWSVGGDYDQPICRRILEEAGIDRELFGQEKKAASILLFDRSSFLPPTARESFAEWCCEHRIGQRHLGERLVTQGRALLRNQGGQLLETTHRLLKRVPMVHKLPVLSRLAKSGRIVEVARYEPEFDHLFPWALAETQKCYQ